MDGDEGRKRVRRVMENLRRLEGCPGPHRFRPHELLPDDSIKNFRCVICGGVVSADRVLWYYRGIRHARAVVMAELDRLGRRRKVNGTVWRQSSAAGG